MPTLYDRQGNPVEATDAEAPAMLASGEYGVPKGAQVPVFSPDGQLGSVPGEKIHEAQAAGYTLATADDVAKADRAEKYGGVGGGLAAAGLEGLYTATLGASDVVGSAVGGQAFKEARKGYREENPNASLAGGVILGLAPALISGGATVPEEAALLGAREGATLLGEGAEAARVAKGAVGLGEAGEGGTLLRGVWDTSAEASKSAAEAAHAGGALSTAGKVARTAGQVLSAPTRAVEATGSAVERGVASLLGGGEGSSLISSLARKAVATGARGAAEGAIVSAGQLASEEALGDPDANGEKVLATLGHGALLGLGAGVGLTAAGELGRAVLGRVGPAVDRMAERQAVRALEPHAAGARKIADLPGGAEALGRRMLADGVLRPGETLEQVASRVSAKVDEAGQRVGAVYDALDASGVEQVRVRDIADRVRREILPSLEKLPETNKAAIGKVHGFLSDLDAFAGIPKIEEGAHALDVEAMREQAVSFRQLQELRSTLRKSINWKSAAFPGVEDKANEALKDVYGALSKELDAKAEQAAGKLGGTMRDELKEANLTYRQYVTADQTAQNALRLKEGRNIAAPSTKAAGMAAGIGLLAHGVSGGASALGAVGAAAANHVFKERGATTMAWTLDKISALRGVEAAAKRVDQQLDRGVARLFKESGRTEPAVSELPIGKRVAEPEGYEPPPVAGKQPYRAHASAIIRASQAPMAHRRAIADAAAPLDVHAPATSAAFQSAAVRATEYLASQLPHRAAASVLTAHMDEPRLSPSEERRYLLVAHAVHDPMSVLRDLGTGTATRVQVDALRAVYPAIYGQLVDRIKERLADMTAPLPLAQRKALGALFGADIDPTRAPAFAARMQQDFAQPSAPAAPKGGAPRGGAPKRKLQGRDDGLALPGDVAP